MEIERGWMPQLESTGGGKTAGLHYGPVRLSLAEDLAKFG